MSPSAPQTPRQAAPRTKRSIVRTTKPKASSTSERQIVFDSTVDRSELAQQAISDKVILEALVENLSGEQRRIRQFSAAILNVISTMEPELLVSYIPQVVDALYRPEAQTRWECLEILSNVVSYDPGACDDAIIGTEASLYDEDSGLAHLAAMRFLCSYGAIDAKRANRVWPFIEEAIQCYHGDPEFQDMLISVTQFAAGHIGVVVKRSLGERMGFDAKNATGPLRRRALAIIELCNKK